MKHMELAKALAERTGMGLKETNAVLNELEKLIGEELHSGGKVQLTGFGTFEVRTRAARIARNPRTGEQIEVAAFKVPAFKAGKALRDAIGD